MSTERDVYQAVQNLSMATVQFFNEFLSALLDKTQSYEGKQSIMALQDCVQKGGSLSSFLVQNKDLQEMQALLRNHNVVYALVEDKDNPGGMRILYRNSDERNVRAAMKDFEIAHDMLNEVELKDFLSANVGNPIHAFQNLSQEEVEVFRFHAQKNGLTFAVQNLAGNKANIFFDQESVNLADKTLKQMSWDLTGGREQLVAEKVKQAIADRAAIEDAVYSGKGQHIIVDKDAKKCLIADREGAVLYRIAQKDKSEFMAFGDGFADKEGNKVLNMEDGTVLIAMKKFERGQLDFHDDAMDTIRDFQQPTLVKMEDLEQSIPVLQRIIAEKGTIYPHGYSAYEGKVDTRTMRNLTQEEMAFVMKRAKELGLTFFAAGKDVAYFAYEQDKMDTIRKELDVKFYKDEPELDRFAREMRYMGKTEIEKAIQEKKEPMYLIDVKKPENMVIFQENEVLVRSGKKEKKLDRKKDIDQIQDYVVAMAIPVAMNAGEINADNRAEILKTHVQSTAVSNMAAQELIKADASKCKLFEDVISRDTEFKYEELVKDDATDKMVPNPLGLSEREADLVANDPHIQAAADRCRNCEVTTYEVNRSVLDALIHEADGRETQERNERTERTETTRTSR